MEKLRQQKLAMLVQQANAPLRRAEQEKKDREAAKIVAEAHKPSAAKRSPRAEALKARKNRRRLNDHLRKHGYRWAKVPYVPTTADPSPLMDDYSDRWALLGPDGNETTVDAALTAIGGR